MIKSSPHFFWYCSWPLAPHPPWPRVKAISKGFWTAVFSGSP